MTASSPVSLLPPVPRRTLPQMLQRQAALQPEAPLLSIGGVHWTHADATRIAATRAALLQAAGVRAGDRVASMCGNRAEALEIFVGCGWAGAVAVPINTASKAPQLQYYLRDSQAAMLVIEAAHLPLLDQVDLREMALRTVWVVGATNNTPADAAVAAPTLHGLTVLHWPLGSVEASPAAVGPGDTLVILYTSGTTGPAKGVICPHGHYVMFGFNSVQMLGVHPGDVLFTTLPLFHINALNTFAQASLVGAHAVIHERFSASAFWAGAQHCGATVVYLLGAMVPMLLAQPAGPAERAHRVRTGLGGGVPTALAESFEKRTGVVLVDGYASTETTIVMAASPGRRGMGSMGWLRPGFQARIVDALDIEVAPGEAGELVLRADEPFVFANGYFGMADKTVEAWRNLWFHTGDRVLQEPDGSYRFIDRMKDAIRRRGENVSSYEVERALLSHPSVAQAAAFPVGSDLAEDEVMVAVIAQPGNALDAADLARHCEARLPYFAVPRYIDIVDELPRTENGKVQKFRLRKRGITATTWERPEAGRRPADVMTPTAMRADPAVIDPATPWLTWFCVWQANALLPLPDDQRAALLALLARCPGLRCGELLLPAKAHDPYYTGTTGSPSLIVQLYFDELAALESALQPGAALAPLADPTFLPALKSARAEQQAMLVRRYPVPDARRRHDTALSYWVEYAGPAVDANAWHLHYNVHHPALLAQFPGIRTIELYTPAVVVCGLPLPERTCLQRNKTVFDDAAAMNAAMASPVREALRADFHSLPPFSGPAHHFPFRTVRCLCGDPVQP